MVITTKRTENSERKKMREKLCNHVAHVEDVNKNEGKFNE
jgi:hypothetical protein